MSARQDRTWGSSRTEGRGTAHRGPERHGPERHGPERHGPERHGPERRGRSRPPGARGFTLIEIMVVVIILGLLAVLVAPRVIGRLATAKDKAARAQIELLGTALDTYRLDNGLYPASSQGLEALWKRPTTAPEPRNWAGPYLRKAVPLDPWGNPYLYHSPGQVNPDSYDLVSQGGDGSEGGEGEDADIRSWE